jgi:eukaryotic-like serine/threonine-protein kinase
VALLALSIMTGIAGIVWQARVANRERRMAEARSADLRQLSNSLLSELDEAIKQLPGSTGVQKLLVTRVLEHLDRMAGDAEGDRQIQLDLVDAYTRLGNIQGNAYDQNLGDPAGALVSLDKALAIARPLAASNSKDREAIRALALVEQSRSEILWQTGNTPEAVSVMREALKSFDVLAGDPDAPAALIYEAGSAYGTLGDELGQSGTASLADASAAVAAYRRSLALDERAITGDPNFLRARRGLSIQRMKIGSVEMTTDPAEALKEFQVALQNIEKLSKSEQDNLSTIRLRAMLLRKQADASEQSGDYSQAVPLYRQSLEISQRLADQDANDRRALFDVVVVQQDQAIGYEDAVDPILETNPGDRSGNLMSALKARTQVAAALGRLVKQEPANDSWKAMLAYTQVRVGLICATLRIKKDSGESVRVALATLKELAGRKQASATTLDQAADAFLSAEPASLRDPKFAVSSAEREVAMSHRKMPFRLLTLAQAYRASGDKEKGLAAAREGLALLPAVPPGSVKPNIRKLLEFEVQKGS